MECLRYLVVQIWAAVVGYYRNVGMGKPTVLINHHRIDTGLGLARNSTIHILREDKE